MYIWDAAGHVKHSKRTACHKAIWFTWKAAHQPVLRRKKIGKKELDRRLTLNKHPAGNTFLVIVNSPTKKQQQQKQKSHTNNNPSIWTNHPSNHSGTAETGRALQSPLQQFAVSFQSILDLKNNFMQVAPKFLCATLIKSKNSFVLARWASLCILKCAPFLWSS